MHNLSTYCVTLLLLRCFELSFYFPTGPGAVVLVDQPFGRRFRFCFRFWCTGFNKHDLTFFGNLRRNNAVVVASFFFGASNKHFDGSVFSKDKLPKKRTTNAHTHLIVAACERQFETFVAPTRRTPPEGITVVELLHDRTPVELLLDDALRDVPRLT